MTADRKNVISPLLSDAVELPFEEGLPTDAKVTAMRRWLRDRSDLYMRTSVVMFHGTSPDVPVLTEGLKPTSATRRRSYQSTSGYVYLANTPERAETFGSIGNGGRVRVYAVRVPVRSLKADKDQLSNHRSVGREVGDSLAESIVHGGGARVKGHIHHADIVEVKKNAAGVYVRADIADEEDEKRNDKIHKEAFKATGRWGKEGAGCWFLSKTTGRLLIPFRSEEVLEPHTWGTWGGAIDPGLTVIEALEKEKAQEAGHYGSCDYVPLSIFRSGTVRYHNYLAIVDDEFEPTLNWETEGYQWVELENLPSPLHPGVVALLAEAKEKIQAYVNLARSPNKDELENLLAATRLIKAEGSKSAPSMQHP